MNIYVTVQNSYFKLGLKVIAEIIHWSCFKSHLYNRIKTEHFSITKQFCLFHLHTTFFLPFLFYGRSALLFSFLVLTIVVLIGVVAIPWPRWEVDWSAALCRVHWDSAVFLGFGDVTKWTRRVVVLLVVLVAASCWQEGICRLGHTYLVSIPIHQFQKLI